MKGWHFGRREAEHDALINHRDIAAAAVIEIAQVILAEPLVKATSKVAQLSCVMPDAIPETLITPPTTAPFPVIGFAWLISCSSLRPIA